MKTKKQLILIIISVSAFAVAAQYFVQGPGWDLIAHDFNGRSLANPAFYSCLLSPPCGLLNQNTAFYFEAYRAPIAGFVLAVMNIIFGNGAIIAYVAVLFAAYLFAIYLLSKRLKIDSLLLYALLLSPFVLYVTILSGSEEIVSLIFLLIGIGYLAKRSPMFGLFLGLATLGKFPVLAMTPMLLLLVKPKKIVYAALLFVVAIVPWLVFSQIFFRNALFSYTLSFNITLAGAQNTGISPIAYAAVFSYPAIFLAMGLLATHRRWNEIAKAVKRRVPRKEYLRKIYNDDKLYLYSILIVFFVLSFAEMLYVAPHYDVFTQARYGYISAISAVLLVAVTLNDLKKYAKVNLVALAAVISIILVLSCLAVYLMNAGQLVFYGVRSPVYGDAASTLASLGYQNCRILSDEWIYMMYYNVSAFSEYDQNITAASQYPILLFNNLPSGSIPWLNQSKLIYKSDNYSVLLPPGYRCYTD